MYLRRSRRYRLVLLGRIRSCATGNLSHRKALPPACLRSWTWVNFAGMSGVKDWDEHWCCRPLLFSYRNSIPGSTGGHVAGASAAYENQALFSCGLHLSCRTGNCWKQDRYNVCSNINYCYTVRYLSFSDNPKCKVLVVEQLRAMVAYENQTTRGLFQE